MRRALVLGCSYLAGSCASAPPLDVPASVPPLPSAAVPVESGHREARPLALSGFAFDSWGAQTASETFGHWRALGADGRHYIVRGSVTGSPAALLPLYAVGRTAEDALIIQHPKDATGFLVADGTTVAFVSSSRAAFDVPGRFAAVSPDGATLITGAEDRLHIRGAGGATFASIAMGGALRDPRCVGRFLDATSFLARTYTSFGFGSLLLFDVATRSPVLELVDSVYADAVSGDKRVVAAIRARERDAGVAVELLMWDRAHEPHEHVVPLPDLAEDARSTLSFDRRSSKLEARYDGVLQGVVDLATWTWQPQTTKHRGSQIDQLRSALGARFRAVLRPGFEVMPAFFNQGPELEQPWFESVDQSTLVLIAARPPSFSDPEAVFIRLPESKVVRRQKLWSGAVTGSLLASLDPDARWLLTCDESHQAQLVARDADQVRAPNLLCEHGQFSADGNWLATRDVVLDVSRTFAGPTPVYVALPWQRSGDGTARWCVAGWAIEPNQDCEAWP